MNQFNGPRRCTKSQYSLSWTLAKHDIESIGLLCYGEIEVAQSLHSHD
jgi:hypothetical protein